PAHRHSHIANRIFQNEVPTNDPRHNLAQRRVGIRVGGSRDRNHRRELGVTKRSKRASDTSDDEGSGNGGTRARASKHNACAGHPRLNEIDHRRLKSGRKCLARRCRSGERKNSRADDGADANGGQRDRSKRAFHLPLRRGRFGDQQIRAFGSEELKCTGARPCHKEVGLANQKLWTWTLRTRSERPKLLGSRGKEKLFVPYGSYAGGTGKIGLER